MPAIPHSVPELIPSSAAASNAGAASGSTYSLYDVAIGGIGFEYATNADRPMQRATVAQQKQRIDQAESPGEQTLTGWWIKSQDSFHGGAGQLYLEPSIPSPTAHIRFDQCKAVDPFTPGRLSRLPDMALVASDDVVRLAAATSGGADVVAAVTASGAVKLYADPTGTPTPSTVTVDSAATSVTSDGATFYVATQTNVYSVTPGGVATVLATYPAATDAVLGWVKARLMLGVAGAVYELDVSQTAVTLGDTQLRYKHPTVGFRWRAFAASPSAVVAVGDGGGDSTITQFRIDGSTGTPVLTVDGEIAVLPSGERVLSMRTAEGSFLAVGTTSGIRVGTFDTYTGALSLGPLHLTPNDPVIPVNDIICRSRFLYAVGRDYDEAGLLCVDLGTQVDQAGRFAWAPSLVPPTAVTTSAATAATVLPTTGRVVFAVAGDNVYVEGDAPGTGRDAWLRTSRIRFGTLEPKLFKLGSVRSPGTTGSVGLKSSTRAATEANLGSALFTGVSDPPEFRLPPTPTEWLSLTLHLDADTVLSSYGVKALPGTRRQRNIQLVLSVFDAETTRTGQRVREQLSARERLAALEALDAAGDEIVLQEFTPAGVVSTIVVIESIDFRQAERPTRTSDIGGNVTVLLRTVES